MYVEKPKEKVLCIRIFTRDKIELGKEKSLRFLCVTEVISVNGFIHV